MKLLAALIAVLTLAGCATAPEGTPSSSPSWINCDAVSGTEPVSTCPAPTSDAGVHPENEAYRDRMPLAAGDQAMADALIPRVTAALQPLADGTTAVTASAVVAAMVTAGFAASDVQVAEGSGVAFGASTGYGCIFGGVNLGQLELDAGGYIKDGGCLALAGH
ncbi:hypothetical protein BH11ACT4_BH11ACT4_17240 [soil metagenome]